MRKEFCSWLTAYATAHENVVVLSGDLGFQALEPIRDAIKERFINAGVAEQNMVSMAAALASEGFRPLCYSIAPFAVFRPAEQIRLDVCIHDLDVKIVGNGGGYGYGIMGGTHHALEDIAVLSSFPNMNCFVPVSGADVPVVCDAMMQKVGPSYLRLNQGTLPAGASLASPFVPLRQVHSHPPSTHPKLTVAALGPMAISALADDSIRSAVDVFVASQVPCGALSPSFVDSVKASGTLLILEEHTQRGGLAEHLALTLLLSGLHPVVHVRNAQGYPSKRYGSQAFHQKESQLDSSSITAMMKALCA
jgi:transketolase